MGFNDERNHKSTGWDVYTGFSPNPLLAVATQSNMENFWKVEDRERKNLVRAQTAESDGVGKEQIPPGYPN